MICAYCGEESKCTKEHIISCSILDLFPECFATIDNMRGKVHQGDPRHAPQVLAFFKAISMGKYRIQNNNKRKNL